MEQQVALAVHGRIHLFLEQVFSEPVSAVAATFRLYQAEKMGSADSAEQARQLATIISTLPELTSINVGFEDGRLVGVNRNLSNGALRTVVIASGTKPFRDVYSVNDDGQRDSYLFKDPNPFVPNTRPWYLSAVQRGKASWNPIYRYESNDNADTAGNMGIGYSMPLYDPASGQDKKIIGAINSTIAIGQISRYLRLLPLGEGAVALVVNEQNQIIGTSNDMPLFHKQDTQKPGTLNFQLARIDRSDIPLIREAGAHLVAGQGVNGTEPGHFSLNGTDYIEAVREFTAGSGLNFRIVVLLPETQFSAIIQSTTKATLVIMAVALLIGVACIVIIAYHMGKPIIHMVNWTRQLNQGKWDVLDNAGEKAIENYPVDEIRQLRQSFTSMAVNLQETVATLEDRVAERTAELEMVNSNLFELSNTDGLTGIPNRRKFDEVLTSEWNRATRTGQPLVLALIDVDWFKKYNDHNGHLAGDDCLRKVANVLKSKIRRASDLVARYGGEEFAIISPGINKSNANEMANIICSAIAESGLAHAMSPFGVVTVSIGVALIVPTLDIAPETLIQAADEALYHAKDSGRNQVVCAEIQIADAEHYFESEFKFESVAAP